MGLFRYSGNKEKLVKYYKAPPKGTKRIVELFLGSGAYSIANSEIPAIGYEINSYLCEMWNFLKTLTVPIIFTYGTSCQTVFPDYEWQKILDKKVPNIRCGGTVDRTENVCYIN